MNLKLNHKKLFTKSKVSEEPVFNFDTPDYLYRTDNQQNILNAFEKIKIYDFDHKIQTIRTALYVRPDFILDQHGNRFIVASGKKRASRKKIIDHKLDFANKRNLLDWDWIRKEKGLEFKLNKKQIRKINKRCFLLANSGCRMYHHWLYDVLPMSYYARKLEHVNFLVNNPHLKYKRDSLALLGLLDRVTPVKTDNINQIEKLHFVPSTADVDYIDFKALSWLRLKLKRKVKQLNDKSYPEKILIIRTDKKHPRRLKNNGEIISYFKGKGFKEIDSGAYSFTDQIKLFHNAKEVVFEHGSAGANGIFCKSKTLVLHLQPDKANGFNQHILSSKYFGHTVGIVFGASEPVVIDPIKPHNVPWSISVKEVKKAYEHLKSIKSS